MEVVCAYCGKSMGTKEGYGVPGTSHGICQECLEQLLLEDILTDEKRCSTESGGAPGFTKRGTGS